MNENTLNESEIKKDLNRCLDESQEIEYIDKNDAMNAYKKFRKSNPELFERLAE